MRVSVLLLTFNEAVNLPRCLTALSWCDDIAILDSGSSDGTIDIARAAGVTVLQRPFDNFASQRNFGLESANLKHDWILHLDADEVVTEELAGRIAALIPPDDIDAYALPSKLMFQGQWLRYSGMYPVYQVRLGRRDVLRFRQVGHGQQENLPRERVAILDEPYCHFGFSHGLEAWLSKHVQYAADEAREIMAGRVDRGARSLDIVARAGPTRRRALKRMAFSLPALLRPGARFFYIYVLRRGFLDGSVGLRYAFMMATYEAMQSVLLMEQGSPAPADSYVHEQ